MLLLGERPGHVDQLTDRLKKLAQKLFEDLPEGEKVALPITSDLYSVESTEHLFMVRQGNLSATSDGRACLYFETGDLIGLTQCYQLPSLTISVDDDAEVTQYEADTLLRYVNETKERQAIWNSYLITQLCLFQDAFGRHQMTKVQPNTGFLNFMPGDDIIRQGDMATEVFTILNGQADVFVDDTQVGKVLPDEIFGAMSVFTGEPRSATVRAKTSCTVLAVPKEEFITLIQSHPQTTMTLIENMSRLIGTLNQQLTQQPAKD